MVSSVSAVSFERGLLRADAADQVLPGFDKGVSTLALQIGGQLVIVDAGLGECRDHLFGIAAIERQDLTRCAVIGEREQRLLGNRIDGVRRTERRDVKYIGGVWVFCARARPEQALWLSAGSSGFLPARGSEEIPVRFISTLRDRNAQTVLKILWDLPHYRFVPAADKHRCHRANFRIEPRGDPPLDPTQVRFGSSDVMAA